MSADCITNTLEGRTVLIVGCTGNIGHNLMNHALAEYSPFARVRGLARKTSKLPAHLRADSERGQAKGLELFDCEAFDLQGYERACEGVDTGICAYQGIEELALDAQLLLLRAAARSGVKQYVGGKRINLSHMPFIFLHTNRGSHQCRSCAFFAVPTHQLLGTTISPRLRLETM